MKRLFIICFIFFSPFCVFGQEIIFELYGKCPCSDSIMLLTSYFIEKDDFGYLAHNTTPVVLPDTGRYRITSEHNSMGRRSICIY